MVNTITTSHGESPKDAMGFADLGLLCAKKAIEIVRVARFYPERLIKTKKPDGSTVTQFDTLVEKEIKEMVLRHFPEATFIGEETGGEFSGRGLEIAIDPIDGTNSFVTHDKTNAFAMTVFEEGKIQMGVIVNSATGEIFSAVDDEQTNLIQLGFSGEADLTRLLPSNADDEKLMLVEVQCSIQTRTKQILDDARSNQQIKSNRSSQGSPALNIAEAAKGFYTYVCDWHASPSTAYDLSAGYKIIKNAGGCIIDIETGMEIDPLGFTGTFIAGIDRDKIQQVLHIFRPCLAQM